MNETWFLPHFPKPDAALRLFCFPFAGGGASTFFHWPKYLPPTIEVWPLQLPGRETRLKEGLLTNLDAIIEALIPAMIAHLDKPFSLFGHSMGALIVFELTRELRRRNLQLPLKIFVAGKRAPHLNNTNPVIRHLPNDELKSELKSSYGSPTLMKAEDADQLMELMLPVIRADLEVLDTYNYTSEPPLEIPVCALGGIDDWAADPNDIRAWGKHTISNFNFYILPGDHFFLNASREELLKILCKELV